MRMHLRPSATPATSARHLPGLCIDVLVTAGGSGSPRTANRNFAGITSADVVAVQVDRRCGFGAGVPAPGRGQEEPHGDAPLTGPSTDLVPTRSGAEAGAKSGGAGETPRPRRPRTRCGC